MKATQATEPDLRLIYQMLRQHYGHRHWWPGETRDEVVIGAILTQGVSWRNVEQAIANLHHENVYTLRDIHTAVPDALAPLLRPTLYYNQKALRLKTFAAFVESEHGGSLSSMFAQEPQRLRARLLEIKGLGPETVDSILLYAGEQPFFVVDAYTDRLLTRLGYCVQPRNYDAWQRLITTRLPVDVELYKDLHAQIVHHCKVHCQRKPLCPSCPLSRLCPGGSGKDEIHGA